MSDGPHKSLPMRKHWKCLAERAGTPSFCPAEVQEALVVSLKQEFKEAQIEEVRAILGGGDQPMLWLDERISNLDAARESCRGSAAGNTFIDCAIEAVANGMTGDTACEHALQIALGTHAQSCCRQIEEHHCRKEPRGGPQVRARLNQARIQLRRDELSAELMSSRSSTVNAHLSKRSGIDEGPSL